jgi:hypothetical protein
MERQKLPIKAKQMKLLWPQDEAKLWYRLIFSTSKQTLKHGNEQKLISSLGLPQNM